MSARFGVFCVVLCLLLVGLAASIYLAHLDSELRDPGAKDVDSFCAVNDRINCLTVAASRFALFMGIPVAVYGVEYYAIALVFLALGWTSESFRGFSVSGLFWMAVLAFPVSLVLVYISVGLLGVFCPVCCVVYVVNLLLGVVLFVTCRARRLDLLREAPFRFFQMLRNGRISRFGALLAMIALASQFLWMPSLFGDSSAERQWQGLPVKGLEIGAADAPIEIEEFTDFQCPFCSRAHQVLMGIVAEYPGRIRLRHRDYPLDSQCNANVRRSVHPHSCRAALFARCSARQGRFWLFSERLFQNQRVLDDKVLEEYTRKLGLDIVEMRSCANGAEALSEITTDIEEGRRIRLRGTPTFRINGELVSGYKPPEFWREKVETFLQGTDGNPYTPPFPE